MATVMLQFWLVRFQDKLFWKQDRRDASIIFGDDTDCRIPRKAIGRDYPTIASKMSLIAPLFFPAAIAPISSTMAI